VPDLKNEVNKTTAEFTRVAQDAAYVAIGLGVIGLQKAQVRRRELQSQLDTLQGQLSDAPIGNVRKELAKAVKDLDKTFGQLIERMDATFEPISERLPAGAQAAVQQAKEARDQLRGYLASLAA
jgi:ABC-type transporter Mla subunit MlaD